MSKKMIMLLNLLFTCLAFFRYSEFGLFHSNTHVQFMLSIPNACLIIARVSAVLSTRFAQNVMHIAVLSIAKLHQAKNMTQGDVNNQHIHPVT
jgi:hypothetical protein